MPINRFTQQREGLVAQPISFEDYTRAGTVRAESLANLSKFSTSDLSYDVLAQDQENIGAKVGVIEEGIGDITNSINDGTVGASTYDLALALKRQQNNLFGPEGDVTKAQENKQLVQLWEAKVEELTLEKNLPEFKKQEMLRRGMQGFTGSFDDSGNFQSFKPEFGPTLDEDAYAREVFAGVKGSELESIRANLANQTYEIRKDEKTGAIVMVEAKSGNRVSNSKALDAALASLSAEIDDVNTPLGGSVDYYNLDPVALKDRFFNLSRAYLTEGETPIEYKTKFLDFAPGSGDGGGGGAAFNLTKVNTEVKNGMNNETLDSVMPLSGPLFGDSYNEVIESEGYSEVTGFVPGSNKQVEAAIEEGTDPDGALVSYLSTVDGFDIRTKDSFVVDKSIISQDEWNQLRNDKLKAYKDNIGATSGRSSAPSNGGSIDEAFGAIYGFGSKRTSKNVEGAPPNSDVDLRGVHSNVIVQIDKDLSNEFAIEGTTDETRYFNAKGYKEYRDDIEDQLEENLEYNKLVPGNITLHNKYTNDNKVKPAKVLNAEGAATNFVDSKLSTEGLIIGRSSNGEMIDMTRAELKALNDNPDNKVTIRSTSDFDPRFAIDKDGNYEPRYIGATIIEINKGKTDQSEIITLMVENQDAQQWIHDNAPNLLNRFETQSKAGVANAVNMVVRNPFNKDEVINAKIVRAAPEEISTSGYMMLVKQENGKPAKRVAITDDFLNPPFLDNLGQYENERDLLSNEYGINVPDGADGFSSTR